jgi:flagellar biosynthesis regulator FlaF
MTMPNHGAAAQGAAAYRRRVTPKQMEAEVFARAARAIRDARTGTTMDLVRAGADNRRLWKTVHGAVMDPTNALPPALRAQIAGVALAVVRECDAAEPDFDFVAEVNNQFSVGLSR